MPLNPMAAGMLQTGIQGGFSIGGNLFSAREAKKARDFNYDLYREDRDWSEHMSNTAWQRGVTDMMRAGINPMMAVSQGGAGQPNSAASVAQTGPISEVSGALNSAAKAANLLNLQQQAANVELTRQTAYKTQQEGNTAAATALWAGRNAMMENMLKGEQWAVLKRQYDLTDAQAKQVEEMLPLLMATEKARAALTEQQTSSAKTAQDLDKYKFAEAEATSKWFEMMGAGDKAAGLGAKVIEALKGAYQLLRNMK